MRILLSIFIAVAIPFSFVRAQGPVEKATDVAEDTAETVAKGTKKAANKAANALTPEANGHKVNVTMTEYKFEMPATAKAGKTSFVIKNAGKKVHNFKIEGQGIAQKLSANPKPGQTEVLQVVLKPGTYAITCPVDFHTQKGMRTTLTVK